MTTPKKDPHSKCDICKDIILHTPEVIKHFPDLPRPWRVLPANPKLRVAEKNQNVFVLCSDGCEREARVRKMLQLPLQIN